MRKFLLGLVFVVVAVPGLASCSGDQQTTPNKSTPVANSSPQPTHEHLQKDEYAVRGRVPAYYVTPPGLGMLQPTLSPELFTGNQRLAYQAAKDIPQILAQLPCYCHCDRSQGHKSLHSCFESEHGENCGICINEALLAHNLQKQGVAVSEIRKKIIAAYGKPPS